MVAFSCFSGELLRFAVWTPIRFAVLLCPSAAPCPDSPLAPSILAPIVNAALKVDDPRVAAAIGADLLTFEAAVRALDSDALKTAGLALNKCRQYHVRKALVRPPLGPPEVTRRGITSVTLSIRLWHPMFDVQPSHVEVVLAVVDGPGEAKRDRVLVLADDGVTRAEPLVMIHRVEGLLRGSTYSATLACVAVDPLVTATLAPSAPTVVRTLDPPGAPPAPEVLVRGPFHLVVRTVNVGLGCDPVAVCMVLEVDGALWRGPGEVGDGGTVVHRVPLDGLGDAGRHRVRCRCLVEDPEVDATLPWSPEVPVVTLWEEQRVALEAAEARANDAAARLEHMRTQCDGAAREHEAALADLRHEVHDKEAARQAAVAGCELGERLAADGATPLEDADSDAARWDLQAQVGMHSAALVEASRLIARVRPHLGKLLVVTCHTNSGNFATLWPQGGGNGAPRLVAIIRERGDALAALEAAQAGRAVAEQERDTAQQELVAARQARDAAQQERDTAQQELGRSNGNVRQLREKVLAAQRWNWVGYWYFPAFFIVLQSQAKISPCLCYQGFGALIFVLLSILSGT
jgi:hypothetical protein